jgi:hypothetical protein
MKIRDIVIEAGLAHRAGELAGTVAANKDQFVSGYAKGKDTMNKIMSPSKWFEPTGTKAANPESQIKGYQTRQSLVQASQGSPIYASDTAVLKDLYSRLKSGNVKTNLELTQVLTAVKSAFNGVALNDEQKKLLGELSKQF